MKKRFLLFFFGLILIFVSTVITKATFLYKISGFQITGTNYCSEPSGFPLAFQDRGEATEIRRGDTMLVADCFPNVDYISYVLNTVFWFLLLVLVTVLCRRFLMQKTL